MTHGGFPQCAGKPPSTGSKAPVMDFASSQPRRRVTLNAGRPARPSD
jgi:hypothetical protein